MKVKMKIVLTLCVISFLAGMISCDRTAYNRRLKLALKNDSLPEAKGLNKHDWYEHNKNWFSFERNDL